MGDRSSTEPFDISCRVGGVDPETATELLRSMVHHQCARCDVPLDVVDALDAAIDDLVGSLHQAWEGIDTIELGSTGDRLDLRFVASAVRHPGRPLTLGPVAEALFCPEAAERPGEAVVTCDLSTDRR